MLAVELNNDAVFAARNSGEDFEFEFWSADARSGTLLWDDRSSLVASNKRG
jgi:hypothetical protein